MPKKVAAIRSNHVRTKSGLRNGYFLETRGGIPKVRGFAVAVLKGRPRHIRRETRRGCWRWTSLRRASQAYRPFLLGWLPGTLKAADGGFEDCKRNAFSFTEGSRKLQQQSVVAVLTPPSIAEVLAACTLPLAACCYWLPLNVRVAA